MALFAKLTREVATAVLPVVCVVLLVHLLMVPLSTSLFVRFLIGVVLVFVGLLLFLFGVRHGLVPFGELLGNDLPRRGSAALVFLAVFLIAFATTAAEPAVQSLATQVQDAAQATVSHSVLVLMVSVGLALFAVVAILRLALGVPLMWIFFGGYTLCIALSLFVPERFVAVAFDASGTTTGPMTVPFLLAFGIGTAGVLQGRSGLADRFGLIGVASIGPVLSVLLLGLAVG